MSKKVRLVVLGIMGQIPFAGVAWQVLQYLEGFRRLGYDVYYVEDTGNWPFDAEQNTLTEDCSYTVNYIARLMAWCGLPDRWAYRSGVDGHIFGMSDSRLLELFKTADVLINLSGAKVLSDEHLRVPVRIYIETDPVLPQIEVAKSQPFRINLLSAHSHHFTFAENLGALDCSVPLTRFNYHTTRQPVILDWWRQDNFLLSDGGQRSDIGRFTTISSWKQVGRDIQWNGDVYYWSKHLEFLKFIDLPARTVQQFELALAFEYTEEKVEVIELLTQHGWHVVDAIALSKGTIPYRDYIIGSRGEFTVAKDQNIRLRSGWFSDRSACYLAAGKPVITQDTGFGNILPTGLGLFSFRTIDQILDSLEQINVDYGAHSRAALRISEEYFAAEIVLVDLLEQSGI